MSLIKAFLNQDASIKPFLRAGNGKNIYGEIKERPCRMEYGFREKVVYKNPAGVIVETVSSALMFVEGEPIPINSLVTHEDNVMRVIRCQPMRGFGPSHLEVLLE